MDDRNKILQIGLVDLGDLRNDFHHSKLDWYFFDLNTADEEGYLNLLEQMEGRKFEGVLCTDKIDNNIISKFSELFEPYSLIVEKSLSNDISQELKKKKCPIFKSLDNIDLLLTDFSLYFYPGQNGGKQNIGTIAIAENYTGEVEYSGSHRLKISGDFESCSKQYLLTWRTSIYTFQGSIKLWLEYTHTDGVELSLTIVGLTDNCEDIKAYSLNESEFEDGIEINPENKLGAFNVYLTARGKGDIEVGSLHWRFSRHNYGEMILGGKKIFDHKKEEIFYYFYPGDLKPPLNVYFSGFKTLEGFEGFNMMKNLGSPFLLLTDCRLKGGSFYIGSKELENKLVDVVNSCLNYLSFSHQELILSGLSMGTFGSLYYASHLSPHAVIIGKPIIEIGTMAKNETIIRPGGFGPSLDILRSLTGNISSSEISTLNQRFIDNFKVGNFDQTKFVIAYMQDDDYDNTAYEKLLDYLSKTDASVIAKGLPGRHSDDNTGIVSWFLKNYQRILSEDFKRKEHSVF